MSLWCSEHSKAGRNLSAYCSNVSNILWNLTTTKTLLLFFFFSEVCYKSINSASVSPQSFNNKKPLTAYINHSEQFQIIPSLPALKISFRSGTLPPQALGEAAGQLSPSCLIQSAAQNAVVSVLASGFCSVLVPLTQTSWQVFTFCSCFPPYPCFPSSTASSSSSSLSLWVSVYFGHDVTAPCPLLCKNGPSVLCLCVS